MKFGFLTDRKSFDCSDFKITTVPEFDDVLDQFYKTINVSNGWFYGPQVELKKTSSENNIFKARGPIDDVSFFRLKPTHQINSNNLEDNHLRFLVLSYGFLQGLYLTPQGFSYLGRTAYEPGKLNGLLLTGDDYVNGMEAVNRFYMSAAPEKQTQMFACIHWYLVGQSYAFDWDRFDAQYKVLDGLYRLSGLNVRNHASRPIELANRYNIKLPLWAKLDSTGKQSKLSKQRNELVHEATYGAEPIGYSYPDENYSLEFTSFNAKLIAATLGLNTPYLAAEPDNREYWGWDILS